MTVSKINDRITKGGNDASLLLSVFTSIGDSRSLVQLNMKSDSLIIDYNKKQFIKDITGNEPDDTQCVIYYIKHGKVDYVLLKYLTSEMNAAFIECVKEQCKGITVEEKQRFQIQQYATSGKRL